MSNYLELSNIPAANITQKNIDALLNLASKSERVESISHVAENRFNIKSDELDGIYSLGRIAGSLHESKADRTARINATRQRQSDIINITAFRELPAKFGSLCGVKKLSSQTIKKLHEYAQTLEPGSKRAQCYAIASYELLNDETVADRLLRDHANSSHAKRQALILVDVGCANEINRVEGFFGTIVFEDGSSF